MRDERIQEPSSDPTFPTLMRAERWRPCEGAHHALLRIAYGDECVCLLLVSDPSSRTWSFRHALLPGLALALCRTDIVAALADMPDRPDDIERFGYISGKGEVLLGLVCRLQDRERPLWHHGRYVWAGREHRRNREAAAIHGYAERSNEAVEIESRPMPPGKSSKPRDTHFFMLGAIPFPNGTMTACKPVSGKLDGNWQEALGFLDTWARLARRRLVETWTPFMDGMHWTNDLAAFYSHPGDVGRNRRQAGELYPLLAPLISNDVDVGALIDAGRPFEDALCDALDAWICSKHPFTRAKLRTLRYRKPSDDPVPVLKLVAALPHDRLRTIFDRTDPGLFSDPKAIRLHAWADKYDLDIVRLTDDLPFVTFPGLKRDLDEISDMITRCADTLVGPSLRDETADARKAAAALLFGDRTFKAVRALSLRWHVMMEAFESALPEGKDLVTWPALFEPFDWEGERLVCLTRPSELRAEGRAIRDRDGMLGLNHCVGGYGRLAYSGISHLVSVRSNRSGEWRRLSTVDLRHTKGGLRVMQHRGPGNSLPSVEATVALDAFLGVVSHGEFALNPEALWPRDERGFKDGIDYTARGVQKAVLAAWAPYLPDRCRGLSGRDLRAYLFGLLGMHNPPWKRSPLEMARGRQVPGGGAW